MTTLQWEELYPDARHTWMTARLKSEFAGLLPVGTKDARASRTGQAAVIFHSYSLGVSTNRDRVAYDHDRNRLGARIVQFMEYYNAEVSRWMRAGMPKDSRVVDDFVDYDKIKWSEHLKAELTRERYGQFDNSHIRTAMYRPFSKQYLYYDALVDDRPASFDEVFPVPATEAENMVIVVSDQGYRSAFNALATNIIPDLHLCASTDTFQCFPVYTYAEDGSNRRDNITDWALGKFQTAYGSGITKRDIFAYVYSIFHHPQYREHFAENLKRELPRVPLLPSRAEFETCVRIGEALMKLHLGYEKVEEYPLQHVENPASLINWRVQRMKLAPDRSAVIYNDWLTLAGILPECFEYRLGTRSALEWVIRQYRVSTDARSEITSDPNRPNELEYIVRLVGRVVTVSVETVRLVKELAAAVSLDSVIGAPLVESQVGAPGD